MKVAKYLTPPSTLILTVDKLSSELFNLDVDELNVMLKDKSKTHSFHETEPKYETKAPKRNNDVVTKFQLQYHGDMDDVVTLTFVDQLVLSVCMTEYLQQNTVVTPEIIFRDLGGAKHTCCFTYRDQIVQSLQKLSQLEIRLNAKDASRFLFQLKGDNFRDVRRGYILPAEEVEVKLNGQECKAYSLTGMSVVYEYARCKGHVAQIPMSYLSVPRTKNTITSMLTRTYLCMRVLRTIRKLSRPKKSKKTSKTEIPPQSIRLDTLYQVCGFTEKITDKHFRVSLMKHITVFLNHLVENKVIVSYKLVNENKIEQSHLKDCTKILFVPNLP